MSFSFSSLQNSLSNLMEGTPLQGISEQLATPTVKEDVLSQWGAVFLALLIDLVVRLAFVGVAALSASKKPLTLCRSVTLSVLASGCFLLREYRARQMVATAMISLWTAMTLALGIFIIVRARRKAAAKKKPKPSAPFRMPLAFAALWCSKCVGDWGTVLPVLVLNGQSNARADPEMNIFDQVGWTIWIVGFAQKLVAELQRIQFRVNPANKGKLLEEFGLWSYFERPNAVGEIMCWIGLFVACNGVFSGAEYAAIMSPVATTLWILSSKPPKKGAKPPKNGAEAPVKSDPDAASAAPRSSKRLSKKLSRAPMSGPAADEANASGSAIDHSAPTTVVKLRRTQKQEAPLKEKKRSSGLFKNILKKRGSKKRSEEAAYREETHSTSSHAAVTGRSVPQRPPPSPTPTTVSSDASTWRTTEPEADYSSDSASSSARPSPPPSPYAAQKPNNSGLPPLPTSSPPTNPRKKQTALHANAARNNFRNRLNPKQPAASGGGSVPPLPSTTPPKLAGPPRSMPPRVPTAIRQEVLSQR